MRLQVKIFVGSFIYFIIPLSPLYAAVVVNEIAWMGTVNSTNDEWIELYNDGSESIDLSGWTLSWDTKSSSPRVISLKGSVSTNGYYLLERTSDATIPNISADLIYVGSLSNSGELLILKNKTGGEVDRVDGGTDWKFGGTKTIGSNTTKETAQRTISGWITATGTPKALNANIITTVSKPETSAETKATTDSSVNKDQNKNEAVESNSENKSNSISSHDSGSMISNSKSKPELVADLGRERVGLVHTPILFNAAAYDQTGKRVVTMSASWTFGDGTTARGDSVTHTYLYPGDYVVLMQINKDDITAVDRTTVHIYSSSLAITSVTFGFMNSEVVLTNNSTREINLGGFSINSGSNKYFFPSNTIMLSKHELTIPYSVSKIQIEQNNLVTLLYPDQTEAYVYKTIPKIIITASSTNEQELAKKLQEINFLEKELFSLKNSREIKKVNAPLAAISEIKALNISSKKIIARANTNKISSTSVILVKKQKSFLDRIFSIFK